MMDAVSLGIGKYTDLAGDAFIQQSLTLLRANKPASHWEALSLKLKFFSGVLRQKSA